MECFHCGGDSVRWCGDFTFEDWGLEGDGVVHTLSCPDCGADVIYEVGFGDKEDDDEADARA